MGVGGGLCMICGMIHWFNNEWEVSHCSKLPSLPERTKTLRDRQEVWRAFLSSILFSTLLFFSLLFSCVFFFLRIFWLVSNHGRALLRRSPMSKARARSGTSRRKARASCLPKTLTKRANRQRTKSRRGGGGGGLKQSNLLWYFSHF